MAALGLHWCMRAFSGRGDWELVSSWGTWAYILHCVIRRPGIELVALLARQGRFLTSGPSAKPLEVMSAYGISKCSASILLCVAVQSRVMGWGAYTEDIGAERCLHGPRPLSESGMKVLPKPSASHRATQASLAVGWAGGGEGGGLQPRCYPGPREVLPLLTAVAPARSSTNTTTVSQDEQ